MTPQGGTLLVERNHSAAEMWGSSCRHGEKDSALATPSFVLLLLFSLVFRHAARSQDRAFFSLRKSYDTQLRDHVLHLVAGLWRGEKEQSGFFLRSPSPPPRLAFFSLRKSYDRCIP